VCVQSADKSTPVSSAALLLGGSSTGIDIPVERITHIGAGDSYLFIAAKPTSNSNGTLGLF